MREANAPYVRMHVLPKMASRIQCIGSKKSSWFTECSLRFYCSLLFQHSAIAAAGEVPSLAVLSPRIFLNRNKKPESQGSANGAASSSSSTNAPPVATFDPSVTSEDMDRLADRFMATLEVFCLPMELKLDLESAFSFFE